MKKTTIILLVAGLLVGAIAGLAFAFGGANETNEADTADDAGVLNGEEGMKNEDASDADTAGDENETFIDECELPENNANALIAHYFSIVGTVVSVEEINDTIRVTIEDEYGNPAVLVLTENTVYPFSDQLNAGDEVTGWYVTEAPMIAIWPAEYNVAVLVAGAPEGSNLRVDRFNTWAESTEGHMLSQDEMFAFLIGEDTEVILANGDDFAGGDIEGRRIVVIYNVSTRSIPELTTATKLIVLYEDAVTLPIDIDIDFEG